MIPPSHLICGDSFVELGKLDPDSMHLCLTDPPYGLDKMTVGWNAEKVQSAKNARVVTSLPAGMRFDRRQGYDLYDWMKIVSEEVFRVLKPGAFFCVFSSPRLYHRVACAVEDAGFLIRDMYEWIYTTSQPKAMSLDHFISRRKDLGETEKTALKEKLRGWKTPQVKSNHEPMVFAQKPLEETFLKNYEAHGVGLVDTSRTLGSSEGMFPSNILCDGLSDDLLPKYFVVPKPSRGERGAFNNHRTVKPLALCEYFISLLTSPGQVVLDPFAGSGTTLVAAKNLDRTYYGIELNEDYCAIIRRRLSL
jgi:DNA modification methylase